MKKMILLSLMVVPCLTFAKSTAIRKPASLNCDHAQASEYIKSSSANYQDLYKDGKLTADELHSLIIGLNQAAEVNALSCGWVKAPKAPSNCDKLNETARSISKNRANGVLSDEEYQSLVQNTKSVKGALGCQ